MKKYISIFALLMVFVVGIGLFAACAKREPESLAIDEKPEKTEYLVGETFSPDGMEVSVVYTDGTSEKVEDYTLSSPDMNTAGRKTITVSWQELETQFMIEVLAGELLSLEVTSDKTEYTIGEPFDPSSVQVTGVYQNDYRAPIDPADCSFTAEMISTGEKTVTVSYTPQGGTAVTASFTIDVVRGDYNGLVSFVPNTAEETKYLVEDESTGIMGNGSAEDPNHRYADGTDYFVYCIDTGTQAEKALLALDLGGQYCIEYSFDGLEWTLLQERTEFAQHAAMLAALPELGENDGKFYFRFKDSTETDGMGADLFSFAMYYKADGETLPEAVGELEALRVVLAETTFDLNDTVSDSMISVYAVYTGGTEKAVPVADCEITRPDMTTPGAKILQATWRGVSGSAALEVGVGTLQGIAVSGPAKTEYVIGEALDLSGLTVEAVYSTGYRLSLHEGEYALSQADMFTLGEKTVTVSYTPAGGQPVTDTFAVSVIRGDYNGFAGFDAITAAENTYLVRNYLSDQWEAHRSMDGDKKHDYTDLGAYVVYGFDGGEAWTDALLFLDISGHYQVTISLDGKNFEPLLRSNGSAERAVEKVELKSFLAGNSGKIWLRISDGDNTDGFGACMYGLDLYYANGGPEETPAAAQLPFMTMTMIPDNGSERNYLIEDNGSSHWGVGSDEDPFHRAADMTSTFTYLFTAEGKYSLATLALTIKGHFMIEVSLDGENWQELEGSVVDNVVTFELAVLLDGAAGNLNFAQNSGFLFLRIGDKSPEDGMGGDLYKAQLTYLCESGNVLVGFVPGTVAEEAYLAANNRSGTGEGYRFADGNEPSDEQNIGAYWVYKFSSETGIGMFCAQLSLNNDRVVEYRLDDGEWVEWHRGNGERIQALFLNAGGAKNVYLRFSDSTKDSGFGIQLKNIGVVYVPAGE